jgi:hypothetical protein
MEFAKYIILTWQSREQAVAIFEAKETKTDAHKRLPENISQNARLIDGLLAKVFSPPGV